MSKNDLVPKRIMNSAGIETTVYVRRDQATNLEGSPLLSVGAPSSSVTGNTDQGQTQSSPPPRLVSTPVRIGSKVIRSERDASLQTGFVTGETLYRGRTEYQVVWGNDLDDDSDTEGYFEDELHVVALDDSDWENVTDALRDRGIRVSMDDESLTMDFQDGIRGVIEEDRSTIRFYDREGEPVEREWNESPISNGEDPSNIKSYVDAIESAHRAVDLDLHNNPYQSPSPSGISGNITDPDGELRAQRRREAGYSDEPPEPATVREYTSDQRYSIVHAVNSFGSVADLLHEKMGPAQVQRIDHDNKAATEAVDIILNNWDSINQKTREELKGSRFYQPVFGKDE